MGSDPSLCLTSYWISVFNNTILLLRCKSPELLVGPVTVTSEFLRPVKKFTTPRFYSSVLGFSFYRLFPVPTLGFFTPI